MRERLVPLRGYDLLGEDAPKPSGETEEWMGYVGNWSQYAGITIGYIGLDGDTALFEKPNPYDTFEEKDANSCIVRFPAIMISELLAKQVGV